MFNCIDRSDGDDLNSQTSPVLGKNIVFALSEQSTPALREIQRDATVFSNRAHSYIVFRHPQRIASIISLLLVFLLILLHYSTIHDNLIRLGKPRKR